MLSFRIVLFVCRAYQLGIVEYVQIDPDKQLKVL